MRQALFQECKEEYGAKRDCHDGAEKINRSVPHYPQLTADNRPYILPEIHNMLFLKKFRILYDCGHSRTEALDLGVRNCPYFECLGIVHAGFLGCLPCRI